MHERARALRTRARVRPSPAVWRVQRAERTVPPPPVMVPVHWKMLSPSGKAEIPLSADIMSAISSDWSLQRAAKKRSTEKRGVSVGAGDEVPALRGAGGAGRPGEMKKGRARKAHHKCGRLAKKRCIRRLNACRRAPLVDALPRRAGGRRRRLAGGGEARAHAPVRVGLRHLQQRKPLKRERTASEEPQDVRCPPIFPCSHTCRIRETLLSHEKNHKY